MAVASNPFLSNYGGTGNAFLSGQMGAIKSGANSGNLISQLFGGKTPAPNMSTPNGPVYAPSPTVSATPSVVASSANVKNTNAPQPPASTAPNTAPNQTVAAGAGTPGYTYTNGILTSIGSKPVGSISTTPVQSTPAAPTTQTQAPPTPPTFAPNAQPAANAAIGNAPIGQSAANIAANYGTQIANVGQQAAIGEESVGGQGLLPIAQGRAQQIAQTASAAENALATGESAALQGTGQELTAQSQEQAGLLGAGQLSTPSNQYIQVPYSNQVVGPDGQQVGGSSSSLQDAVNNAINEIKNGAGYQNAAATLSAYGQAGTNALLTALGPNFNINSSNADAAASAQNINTQETSQTTIGQQGLGQATQAYTDATTTYNTISNTDPKNPGQMQILQNVLSSTGINASNSSDWNNAINNLQGRMGSTNYSAFTGALRELQASYSTLLSSGNTTPSANDAAALATLDPSKSAAQINASLQILDADAKAKLNALNTNVQTYQGILNGGSATTPQNSNANSTQPAAWL